MSAGKITPVHVGRMAYVYVRQSTMTQVHDNRESQRRQYELAAHARTLGWTHVEVIDEDLGRSGSGRVARPGFERLVSAVCLEEVGAVLALEASRLARNSRDWAHLVDLCGLTGTLIIDGEGVYDPRDFNDRLLLGLKGTMSEWELGVLRQRSLAAIQQKAERGEMYTTVAIGYLRTRDATGRSRVELDPDQRIQDAIRSVFRTFVRTGSVRQTHLWFRSEGIALPAVVYGPFGRSVVWKLPLYNTVHHLLTNPIYAGAYAYGRTTTRTTVTAGRAVKRHSTRTPQGEWAVLLRDHHPGYIGWSEYEANQATIAENAQMKGLMGRGAPRRGVALLAGLLRCRRCGRRLHVAYSGTNGQVRRYACQGAAINHGTEKCLSFGGRAVEAAVEAAVLVVIAPGAIDAAIRAAAQADAAHDEKRAQERRRVEHARYETERTRRQYDAVDPANRLVAAELERRWNAALTTLAEVERALAALDTVSPTVQPIDRAALLALADDLPAVWHDPRTDPRLKKRIVRTLIEEILVDVDMAAAQVHGVVRWAGGQHTTLSVKKNRKGQHRHVTDRDVVALVQQLVTVLPDAQIAAVLNRLGYRTRKGNTWTASRVVTLRGYHEIPVHDPAQRERDGLVTLEEAAARAGVSAGTVRRCITDGLLPASQVVAHAPWIIKAADLDAPVMVALLQRVRTRARAPRQMDRTQLSLDPPPTL